MRGLDFFCETLSPALAIRFGYTMDKLGDDAETHRWRAWWSTSYDNVVTGIELRAYPVMRRTPSGVWIDTAAGRQATRQPWEEGAPAYEWTHYGKGVPKWLADGSGSAWAKPTRDEAIRSLAIRLTRWSGHLARDVKRARQCAEVLAVLRPDLPAYAETARRNLEAAKPEGV